jgi:hypothetical protein
MARIPGGRSCREEARLRNHLIDRYKEGAYLNSHAEHVKRWHD